MRAPRILGHPLSLTLSLSLSLSPPLHPSLYLGVSRCPSVSLGIRRRNLSLFIAGSTRRAARWRTLGGGGGGGRAAAGGCATAKRPAFNVPIVSSSVTRAVNNAP